MKTALFDLDGTLIDSVSDLASAINRTRGIVGLLPRKEAEIGRCIGDGLRKLVERAIPEFPERWDELLEIQKIQYAQHCLDATCVYPGTREALSVLREKGWKLAVVTNKTATITRTILEGLQVLPLLDAVVGGGDTEKLKPDPAPLFLAAERMGITLDASDWMVGDHFTDLKAARLAGLKSCFCRFGIGETRGESFTAALDSMSQLPDILL